MEDSEGQSYVKYDSGQSWSNSHVETHETLSFVYLCETIGEAFVFVRVNSLHLGLNHINRVIEHRRTEASECSRGEVNYNFVRNVILKDLLGIFKHDESNTLIGGLLHEGGHNTLVATSKSLRLYNCVNTVEEVSILGLRGELVVDKLGLEGLLGSHNKDSFSGTSADTAQKVVSSVSLGQDILLNIGVGSESDIVLGY